MPVVARHHDRVGAASLASLQVDGGATAGPTLVLLHGIPTGAELWRGVLGELGAAHRRAVAPDLPGYGETVVPPSFDHSLAGAAELVAAWLRQRDEPPVWLVGHDLGGAVAQLLAVRHPDLVGRLTLGDCVVGGDTWPVTPIRLLRLLARLRLYDGVAALGLASNAYSRWQLRRGFADPTYLDEATYERVFWARKVRLGPARRAFARHLRALEPRDTATVEHELADLTVPTQLVWAAGDRFLPFDGVGTRLRDALPDPAVTVVDDAGHFLPLERPRAYVDALLAWGR